MKTITRDRILKALDRCSKYLDDKPEIHIIQTLAQVGLRAAVGEAFGTKTDPMTERDRLELAYQGFTDPEKILQRLSHWNASYNLNSAEAIIEAWQSSFQRTLEKSWARRDRIYDIQRKYGVSGLEETETDFDGVILKHYEPSEELVLLDSDYEVMQKERTVIVGAFVDMVDRNQMTLYCRVNIHESDDWVIKSSPFLLSLMDACRCAKVWKHGDVNNRSREFHLVLAKEDPDLDEDSVWFCASHSKPSF